MTLSIPDLNKNRVSESKKDSISNIDDLPIYMKQNLGGNQSENLLILRKLHKILQNSQNLTDEQKLDYCKSERYFMKLYLKEIARRG